MLLPDVLNTRQFTWVWVVKINAIWIGRAKVCTLEEDDVFIISTCCIKYHSMVMYISSAANYFRSMYKSNNSLCIYPKTLVLIWKSLLHFKSVVGINHFLFYCVERFLFSQPGYLTIQRWNNFQKPLHPFDWSLFRCEIHLWTVLESEEMLTWSMIELLNDSLLPMNVHISSSYFYTMLCYLCCDFTCEFMPRITTWRTLGYQCGTHL